MQDVQIDRKELEEYISENIHHYIDYFSTGFGNVLVGKAAEHYLSLKLSHFNGGVCVDIAASASPYNEIVKKVYPHSTEYRQDKDL